MHGRLALLTIAILCVGVWEFRKAASQDTNTADSDSCNQKLHKKTIAPDRYPFARCSDHSPAIYYDSNTPPKPGNERWMIFLEGGGVCSNQSQCVDRYRDQPYLMSSNVSDVYGDSLCGTDVFNATDQLNPFKDFHHILLPYCTQDVYIGSNTGPLRDSSIVFDTNNPGNFSHSGSFVFRAMIDTLSPQLLSAKEIILGGTSAGALGSLNQARWMQEQFPQADIKLLLDSGWIIDYKAIGRGMLFTKFAQQSSNLSAHAACQVMHEGLPCCLSPVCMLENTEVGVPAKIPILVITSSYDLFMLQIAVASSPPIPRQEYFDLIADYGGAMNQTLNAARSRNGTSLIQTRCSQHTYIVSSTLWRSERLRRNGSFAPRPVAGGVINFRHSINDTVWDLYKLRQANGTAGPNMQSLISSWYTASLMGVEFNISDACGQFLCNSNCPDGLALGGIDSSFSSGLQIFVVTVAVLIAVGTFLIKVALKMQLLLIHRSMKKLLSEADKNLSDCLPESSDVSVACYNLSYSLTIPIAVKDDDEEEDDMVTEANTDERTRRNTYLKMDKTTDFVDGVSRPEVHGNGLTRSASLPSPVTSRPVTPKRFFSVMEGSHTKKRPARQTEIKVIVNGVTAYFNSGSMVAIMGPSGCGKTTLMDLLTGRRAGDIEGEVLVNGHPLDDVHSWYHRNTGYVRQLATPYYDELTVRENLLYSALLRLPSSHTRAELFEQMKMVINEVGLSEIEDRRVGGSTGGGISGGEKRRLCVAMQLMGMPNIVFLDEPTSGLDSTAAKDLLNVLHIIAQGNRLVVLSIHQPRPEIYHLFAKILFLCNGQVAFYGSPEKAIKFFMDAVENRNPESFQKLASEKYNPADLILDALNDEHNQECILEHYKLSPEPTKIMNRVKAAKIRHETQSVLGSAQTRSFWSALLSLEGRMRRQSWGQAIYLPLVFFFYGLGVGIAYFQAEKGFLILAAFNLLTNISFLFVSPALTNVILGRCLHIFEMEHGDGVMRVSHFVLHAFIHMTAITMIPFAVLTALIFYMVSTVGATFTDFLLILLVNLTANGTDVAIVILICVTIPTYATPIAHVVCAYVTFFEGFLYPVPDIHEAIRWLVYGNPNYYAYSSEMRILLSGRQLPCDRPPLHCVREDGNSILEEFGFDNADPYVSMLIMILMTIFYLILSMIALLPKGYIKNYFHAHYGHPFSSKDDRENVEYPLAEVSEEESAEIVHGPLVHTSAVWTTLKRQATRANLLNRLPGPIIVPCADYVPGDTASRPRLSSGGKANLVKRQKSLAVVTSTSTEQQRTLAKGASSYWKSKITLSRTTPPVEFVSSDEPARRAAMHWLAVTRLKKGIRSESLDNGGIASASTKLMAASIMKWSRTVQEKQLKDRREQSKRQIDGGKRLVEESLDLLLNQVRNRSGSDTSNMTASRANAVGNWRRATKRLKRREEEWRAEVKSSTQTDSAPVLDSVDGHRKGRPEGKMKRVQIQEMPLIHEDTDTDDVVHSMDRSPRLGLSSRGSAQDGVLHGDTSQQSLRPQPSPPTPSITEVSNSRDSRLSTSSCDSQGSVKPLTPSRSSSLSSSSIKMPVPVLTEEPRKYSHHRHRLQSRESYHQMVDEPATQSSIGGRSPGKKRGSRVNTHETAC